MKMVEQEPVMPMEIVFIHTAIQPNLQLTIHQVLYAITVAL